MSEAFRAALAHVLRHEGGYVNDPRDSGGETKFGISKRAYPKVDIAALTLESAAAIYRRDYWDRVRGDDLPPELQLPVFDMAVNQGPGAATKELQRAALVQVDGKIGPETLQAVRADVPNVWIRFMAARARRYAGNAQVGIYGKGWFRRLMDVALASLKPNET